MAENAEPTQPRPSQQQDSGSPPTLPLPFANTTPAPELITQGAEGLVYRTFFLSPSTPAALKYRPSKPYRHPTLDARLTKQRVLAEARVLVKLATLRNDEDNEVHVPGVLSLEWDVARKVKGVSGEQRGARNSQGAGAWMLMEWVEGISVKDLLRQFDAWFKSLGGIQTEQQREEAHRREEDIKKLLRRIGRAVGALHSRGGVVHGDLTSSNVMLRPETGVGDELGNGDIAAAAESTTTTVSSQNQPDHNTSSPLPRWPSLSSSQIYLIDFGLATQSVQDEDRAVDLYVLERAFGSTHPRQEAWFDAEVLQSAEGYRGSFKGASVVLKRLEEVRLRGRKRSMVG